MPQVKKALEESGLFAPETKIQSFEPEHAISYGAARYADTLQWDSAKEAIQKTENIISLIAPHSYGIVYAVRSMQGRDMIRLFIKKGEKLPASARIESVTKEEGVLFSDYAVYEVASHHEGLYAEVEEGTEIMEVLMERKEPVPKGTKTVQILTLEEDGVLHMRAEDEVCGLVVENEIQTQLKMV